MNIDQNILSKCLKGEKCAEKALFSAFASKVYTICSRYSANGMEAKDLLQECFIIIFKKLYQFDENKGELGAWIHKICVRTILNVLKKQNRYSHVVYMENLKDVPVTESDLFEIQETELIAAIQQLPNGYREVINLFIYENWSHKEIGEHLGIAEATSRSQLNRAKAALKIILLKSKKKLYEKRLA